MAKLAMHAMRGSTAGGPTHQGIRTSKASRLASNMISRCLTMNPSKPRAALMASLPVRAAHSRVGSHRLSRVSISRNTC